MEEGCLQLGANGDITLCYEIPILKFKEEGEKKDLCTASFLHLRALSESNSRLKL